MQRSTLAAIGFLILFAACSGASFDDPQDALRTFLDRSIDGDKSGARACLVADEQALKDLRFQIDRSAVGYTVGDVQMEQGHAVVPVRFPGESEDMFFVLVDGEDSWRVSLGFTLARGMTAHVGRAMEDLGPNPTPQQMEEAMRRAMQNGSPRAR